MDAWILGVVIVYLSLYEVEAEIKSCELHPFLYSTVNEKNYDYYTITIVGTNGWLRFVPLSKNTHAPPWVTNQIIFNNNHLAELMFTWSPTGDGERNEA